MVKVVPGQLFTPQCYRLNSPALVVLSCCEIICFNNWQSGRASDSKSRGPGFDPHRCHRIVSLRKTHLLPTVLVKPRKRWLRPDMAEKLLTWTLSLNDNISVKMGLLICILLFLYI